MVNTIIPFIVTLITPFFFMSIEKVIPYPFLIEEMFKFAVISKLPRKNNYAYPVILGLLFSVSETILYMFDFYMVGNFTNLPARMLYASSLHVITFTLLYNFRKSKTFSMVSLFLVIIFHYVFNRLVTHI